MYSKYLLNYSRLGGEYREGLSRVSRLARKSSFLLWPTPCFSLLIRACPMEDCL